MIELVKEKIPYVESNEKLVSITYDPNTLYKSQKMELEGLEDLINLISSVMSNDFSIYHYNLDEKHIYFVYVVIHDFYNLRGVPVLIYVKSDISPGLFLKYQTNRIPTIKMTNKFEDASAVYIKIIKVKSLPDCLEISN
ncbi:MAG: hypothetical protein ACTSPY_05075 [Candidatus Helarchaeota archaeon]